MSATTITIQFDHGGLGSALLLEGTLAVVTDEPRESMDHGRGRLITAERGDLIRLTHLPGETAGHPRIAEVIWRCHCEHDCRTWVVVYTKFLRAFRLLLAAKGAEIHSVTGLDEDGHDGDDGSYPGLTACWVAVDHQDDLDPAALAKAIGADASIFLDDENILQRDYPTPWWPLQLLFEQMLETNEAARLSDAAPYVGQFLESEYAELQKQFPEDPPLVCFFPIPVKPLPPNDPTSRNTFDGREWFLYATSREILHVAGKCGWNDNSPTSGDHGEGLAQNIDKDRALRWIKWSRPHIYRKLTQTK